MSEEKILDALEPIAREATREALRGRPITDEIRANLTLGRYIDGEYGVFDLYLPADRPQDARPIATTRVHRVTQEVAVEVFI